MDLELISGEFQRVNVPKSQEYLLKYFDTPARQRYLSYYLRFNGEQHYGQKSFCQNFMDHTGVSSTVSTINKWGLEVKRLEEALKKANADFDLALVEKIKSGNYRVRQNVK